MAQAGIRRAVFYAIAPERLLNHPGLTDGAKQTWLWLDLKAGRSRLAKASYAEIAKARRCTTKSAARHVRALVEAGFLSVKRAPAGHGKAHYTVLNDARSVDTNVYPDGTPESTQSVVDGTPESALLESSKEVGEELVPGALEGTDGWCFRCPVPTPATHENYVGDPVCWKHVDV